MGDTLGGVFRGGLFLEHGDSRDDVTIVLYFRFLKKNKNKVVSNRCNVPRACHQWEGPSRLNVMHGTVDW